MSASPKTSYKVEVKADSSGMWASNQLRFADERQAQAYAEDLNRRWTSVREFRVAATRDPVNAGWSDGSLEHLR